MFPFKPSAGNQISFRCLIQRSLASARSSVTGSRGLRCSKRVWTARGCIQTTYVCYRQGASGYGSCSGHQPEIGPIYSACSHRVVSERELPEGRLCIARCGLPDANGVCIIGQKNKLTS